jgi:hypothetical protein
LYNWLVNGGITSALIVPTPNGINTSTSCYSSSDNLSEMCTPANGGGVDDNSSTKEIDVIRSNDCKTITDTTTTIVVHCILRR